MSDLTMLWLFFFCCGVLAADTVQQLLWRRWRLRCIRRRRVKNTSTDPCWIDHSWGPRFGPVDPPYSGASYSWGWRCRRCPATKTVNMSWADREAAVHYEKMIRKGAMTMDEYRTSMAIVR